MDDVNVEFQCAINVTVRNGQAETVTFEMIDDVDVYNPSDEAGLFRGDHDQAIEVARAPIVDLVEYINHYETEEPPL